MDEQQQAEVLAEADHQLAHPVSEQLQAVESFRAFARRRPVIVAAVGILVAIAGLYGIATGAAEKAANNSNAVRELQHTQQELRKQLAEERRQRDILAAQVAGANTLLGARVLQLLQLLHDAGVTVPALTTDDVRRLLAGQTVTTPAAPEHGNQGPQGPPGPPGPSGSPGASSRPTTRPTSRPTTGPRPTSSPPPPVVVCVRNPISGELTCVPNVGKS